MQNPDHPHHPSLARTRRRGIRTFGSSALALLAVIVPACSSGKDTAATTTSTKGSSSSVSTTEGGSPASASTSSSIDPCSIVTDAVAAKVYGAGSTVTATPAGNNKVCSVSVTGLSHDLNVTVGSVSDYQTQKAVAFKNSTDFPGLGNEAVIGTSSDSTGAQPGLLYRTDSGMVYIGGESDQAKLTALAGALAAQG